MPKNCKYGELTDDKLLEYWNLLYKQGFKDAWMIYDNMKITLLNVSLEIKNRKFTDSNIYIRRFNSLWWLIVFFLKVKMQDYLGNTPEHYHIQ